MDLFGGVLGGGIGTQALGVIVRPVGQFPDAVLCGGFLFQFGEVVDELAVGRIDRPGDLGLSCREQAFPVRSADLLQLRQFVPEDSIELVLVRRGSNEGGHLVQHTADHKAGWNDAFLFPGNDAFHHLVELDPEPAEALDVIAPFELADHRVEGHHEVGHLGLDAEHLVEGIVVVTEALAADDVVEEVVHDAGGEPRGRADGV